MKSESQVRQKLKQAAFRRLKTDLLEPNFKRAPGTCRHNVVRRGQESVTIGLCSQMECPTRVCDARFDGDIVAAKCPFWAPCATKEHLRDMFAEQLRRPRHEVAALYPDLAALMWVLDDSVPLEGNSTESSAGLMLPQSRWQRLLSWCMPWRGK